MALYRIRNKGLNQFKDVEVESVEEAFEKAGWQRGDCEAKVRTEKGGWANVDTGEIEIESENAAVILFLARCKEEKGLKEVDVLELLDVRSVTRLGYRNLDADWQTVEQKVAEGFVREQTEVTEKPVEEVAKIDKVIGQPSEGEKTAFERRLHIMQLAQGAQSMFLKMGALLYQVREEGEWSIMNYESFNEYIEDLKLPMQNSYSWATRLIGIYEYLVKDMQLPETILIEIGVAKLTRLLPAAREGRLTMDLIEQAKALSDMDLRAFLGHNVDSGSDSDEKPDMIICPRCGDQFNAKKAQRVN